MISEGKNPAYERMEKTQRVTRFVHEMRVMHNQLLDGSTSSPALQMNQGLRRRQEYRLRKIIEELDRLSMKLRFNSGAELPADLDAYLKSLRDSIPQMA